MSLLSSIDKTHSPGHRFFPFIFSSLEVPPLHLPPSVAPIANRDTCSHTQFKSFLCCCLLTLAALIAQTAAATATSPPHTSVMAGNFPSTNPENAGGGAANSHAPSSATNNPASSEVKVAFKKPTALSRWKKLTGTAMFINRLGKETGMECIETRDVMVSWQGDGKQPRLWLRALNIR